MYFTEFINSSNPNNLWAETWECQKSTCLWEQVHEGRAWSDQKRERERVMYNVIIMICIYQIHLIISNVKCVPWEHLLIQTYTSNFNGKLFLTAQGYVVVVFYNNCIALYIIQDFFFQNVFAYYGFYWNCSHPNWFVARKRLFSASHCSQSNP